MTASDARPPSDTGTTGWHLHGEGEGMSNPQRSACRFCYSQTVDPARPVLVVDPAEARETIARALYEVDHRYATDTWERLSDLSRAPYYRQADAVLAALAGQGQP